MDHVKIILRSQICDMVVWSESYLLNRYQTDHFWKKGVFMSVIRKWFKCAPLVICHNRNSPEFCIPKEFKSRESLYMWFRLDFEAFLARMSQLENRQVLFIFSMCFDIGAPWTMRILRLPRIKLVKLFKLGAQENRIGYLFSLQVYKYIGVLCF